MKNSFKYRLSKLRDESRSLQYDFCLIILDLFVYFGWHFVVQVQ